MVRRQAARVEFSLLLLPIGGIYEMGSRQNSERREFHRLGLFQTLAWKMDVRLRAKICLVPTQTINKS
jgi:hypothetical protein